MDSRSKALLFGLFLLAIIATGVSFYKYMVVRDITFFTEGFSLEEEDSASEEETVVENGPENAVEDTL